MSSTKWALDPAHSEVMFKVRHLLVSNVTGHFKQFNAAVETQGDDFTTAKVNFTAEVDSITTNNDQRDGHLKNNDFFDQPNHPQLTFVSDGMEKVDADNYKLHGTLTMRGNSKPVTFNVEFGGQVTDPWGNTRVGFSVTGKVNRMEYGVSFGMVSETGGILLGEDVSITASAEFVKVAAAVTA